jgi:hypothetical protein
MKNESVLAISLSLSLSLSLWSITYYYYYYPNTAIQCNRVISLFSYETPMETTDEWTIRCAEEELNILYLDWESWYDSELEHLTINICLECGNALHDGVCEVCE